MSNRVKKSGEKGISIPGVVITNKIYLIRRQKVMLEGDLALLYGVETKQLKRQVRRNKERFPSDFMFELSRSEYREFLRCQFGTIEKGSFSKYLPYAFTEQGVAMLSSVLNSRRSIIVNIAIMRAFIKLRRILESQKDLLKRIEVIEKKYDGQFQIVFQAIRELMAPPPPKEKKFTPTPINYFKRGVK